MANTYKNIVITPNRDSDAANVPSIRFSGGDITSNTDIHMKVYTASNGTLSFEGTAGQLFSITNDLTNSIFSVNDVSGIPSIDVNANGLIQLAPYGGEVTIDANTTFYENVIIRRTATNANATIRMGSGALRIDGGEYELDLISGAAGAYIFNDNFLFTMPNAAMQMFDSGAVGSSLSITLSSGGLTGTDRVWAMRSNGEFAVPNSISFGSQTVVPGSDLTRHLNLWGGQYGMSISSLQQNYIVPSGANHVFYVTGTERARVNVNGLHVVGGINASSILINNFDKITAAYAVANVANSGTLIRAPQILTSGTSYTTPAGCREIYAELVGGGGAGGGIASATTTTGAPGGGAGAYCAAYFTVLPSTSYAYVIGAGGAGVSAGAGGNGGNTTLTIGSYTIRANGGTGGTTASGTQPGGQGGVPGAVITSNTIISGGGGGMGGAGIALSGQGGASYFGGGAKSVAGAATGERALANGAGGSGASSAAAGANRAGGAGAAGLIRIWEYM